MFSLTNNKTSNINRIIGPIVMCSMLITFLGCCCFYAFKASVVFPIINSLLLIASFFLFKGKYRLYSFFLSMPFIVFFNYKPWGIGSFYSYAVIIYCILIVIEFFLNKNKKVENTKDFRRVVIVLMLALYSIILTLINGGISGVIKTISIFSYIGCVSLFFFDYKSKKDLSVLILLIGVSLLIANVLACFILFFIKGDIAVQFLERFASKSYALHYKANNASFRYPGLANDPNYLGLYTLLITSVVAISFKKLRFKVPILIITLLIQIFPLIGESKNYFLVVILIGLIIAFSMLWRKNGVFISVGILSVGLIILILGNSILLPTILRLINIDSRDGFLNALTTGRTSIQLMYFNEYLSHPTSLLFGRGFNTLLNDASAHSVYVMSFWYFGIFGTILYYYWVFSYMPFSKFKKNKILLMPLLIMVVYALSLDYISY